MSYRNEATCLHHSIQLVPWTSFHSQRKGIIRSPFVKQDIGCWGAFLWNVVKHQKRSLELSHTSGLISSKKLAFRDWIFFRQEWVMKPCEAMIFRVEHLSWSTDVCGAMKVMLHIVDPPGAAVCFPWSGEAQNLGRHRLLAQPVQSWTIKVSKSRQEVHKRHKSIDPYDSRKPFNLLQDILDVWMLGSLGGSLSDALRTHPRGWSRVGLRLSRPF